MILSPNEILGALVYRTREALSSDVKFLKRLREYVYHPNCLVEDKFMLWHYPGTHNEISNVLTSINSPYLKFPAFLNFHSIRQDRAGGSLLESTIHYNIAIAGVVDMEWLTETREGQVFDPLLRPIYQEFIRQIVSCGFFNLDYGIPPHTCYEVFTTGNNRGNIIERYGDYIDAIEIHNLKLTVKSTLCGKHLTIIKKENALVTEGIDKILKH